MLWRWTERVLHSVIRWWRHDRIAGDPRHNRLLWLEPRSVVTLLNSTERVVILERHFDANANHYRVCYSCESCATQTPAELVVTIDATRNETRTNPDASCCSLRSRPFEMEWRVQGHHRKVDRDELQIYEHASRRHLTPLPGGTSSTLEW